MTDEDKKILADAIAGELEDSAYGIETAPDRQLTAVLVAERMESLLRQRGWMPPETLSQISHWAGRTGKLPEHHLSRDVLTSHLRELTDILNGR